MHAVRVRMPSGSSRCSDNKLDRHTGLFRMKLGSTFTTDALVTWLGEERPLLQQLLDLLDVGPLHDTIGKHGNGLWRALFNLERIEPELVQLLPEPESARTRISDAMTLLRALAKDCARDEILPSNWLIAGKPRDAKRLDVAYPQHSTIDAHPLSAALWRIESGPWVQNADHLENPRIRLLAAALIAGQVLRPHEGDQRKRGRLIKACLALREFVNGLFLSQLAQLPASALSISDYCSQLTAINDSAHPVGSIERYLAWAVGARDLDNDNRGLGGGGRKKRDTQAPSAHIERSQAGEIDTIAVLPQSQDTQTDPDACAGSSGAPLGEVTQSTELIHAPLEEHVDPQIVSRAFTKTRARSAAVGIARENQRLGGRLSSLTDLEAKLLIRKLRLDAGTGELSPGALLACTSLLVGRSIDAMAYTLASNTFPNADVQIRNPQIVRSGAGFFWVVKPGAPDVATAAIDKRIVTNPTPPWLLLPCPSWFGTQLYEAIEKGRFRDREKVVSGARRFLQDFDQEQNGIGRYRADKLFSWLPTAMGAAGHSGVVSAIITGDVRAAAKAPMHYEQWSESDIQLIYTETLSVIEALDTTLEDPDRKGGMTSGAAMAQMSPTPSDRRFGSIFAPDLRNYANAIKALRARLAQFQGVEKTPLNISTFHNDYAVYVWQFVSVGLALRGVNNALPSLGSISQVYGFTVIRDKDSADGYHARLLPCPGSVSEQLRLWLEHIDEIRLRLALLDPAGVAGLGSIIAQGDMPQPFMIDRDGKISGGQVSDLMRAGFERDLPYPPNVGRHIVSTSHAPRLPVEELRAAKGHWIRGTEPFSILSGLDPQAYVIRILEHQGKLLDLLGFKPLRGMH
jgi:hypothetical protein